MTHYEMNGHKTKKIRLRCMSVLIPVSVLGLCGCAGIFEAGTDPSMIQDQVQRPIQANRSYPRWDEFPRATIGVPGPAAIAGKVEILRSADRQLQLELVEIEWTLGDTEAFEAEVGARLSEMPVLSGPILSVPEIEAMAESLRQKGKAPPPVGTVP